MALRDSGEEKSLDAFFLQGHKWEKVRELFD